MIASVVLTKSFLIDRPQLLGQALLLAGSISLGLVAYLVADVRRRKAFLDTRQSSEMRLTIEKQAKEQVSGLLKLVTLSLY